MQQRIRGRQRHAAGQEAESPVEAEVASLSKLSMTELRMAWIDRSGEQAPAVRARSLLLKLFAWQMQSQASGGLDAVTLRKLDGIAEALERDSSFEPKLRKGLSSGVVLTREWKGAIHKVTVTADGFRYLGKVHGSLSEIARTITGTRWSGPRFFGLEQKEKMS
ncbi:MAG TPA: DUF2924 domain-containing protein [Rhizomicrobium sp.]|jgi:hypothetical protein